jgi:hypothetical protein
MQSHERRHKYKMNPFTTFGAFPSSSLHPATLDLKSISMWSYKCSIPDISLVVMVYLEQVRRCYQGREGWGKSTL